ncbi:hypothetical protein NPIL_322941 [Nephila pilipes]|uniref:Uncharacterized protein n=1 Tax=Nephila pilipes TaxID=299642 RepID=A0A8X6R1V2_NEPPI|nr:hypothetical protein NPIL_322941 [Nephila pilipes]
MFQDFLYIEKVSGKQSIPSDKAPLVDTWQIDALPEHLSIEVDSHFHRNEKEELFKMCFGRKSHVKESVSPQCQIFYLGFLFCPISASDEYHYEAKEGHLAKCSYLKNFWENVSVLWAREVANHQLPWLHFAGVDAIFADKMQERNPSSLPSIPSPRFPKDPRHSFSKFHFGSFESLPHLPPPPDLTHPALILDLLRVEKEMILFLWSHFQRIL